MIVCSCHAVSEDVLRAAAARGASRDEVMAATGAGTGCGCCRHEVESILSERNGPCRADPCPGCPRRAAA